MDHPFIFLFDVLGSLFWGDDCHHHHCESDNMGWMVAIPIILVAVVFLYGYHSAYQDSPPKRVFISDVDGSKDSPVRAHPVAQKAVAKTHPSAHPATHAKSHSTTHHQVALHAK